MYVKVDDIEDKKKVNVKDHNHVKRIRRKGEKIKVFKCKRGIVCQTVLDNGTEKIIIGCIV